MINDIVTGERRCSICFGKLPCREHPAPPKLEVFTSENQLAEMVAKITPENQPGLDEGGWPLSDSPFTIFGEIPDGRTSPTHEIDYIMGPIEEMLREAEVKEKIANVLSAVSLNDTPPPKQDNVVAFTGVTYADSDPKQILNAALTIEPQMVIVLGFDKDGNEFFRWSSGDTHTNNFLLDRAKRALMDAYDDENGYLEG